MACAPLRSHPRPWRKVLWGACLLTLPLSAQPGGQGGARVEIIGADEWRFDENIAPGAQRLKGNVRFRHGNALMFCDSAYLYKDQQVEAFGSVRIVQGDSLHLHGDHLIYDGTERIARVTGEVVLEDPSMRLETTALTHELRARRAVYDQGAVVTANDGHVLTSHHGVYHTEPRLFVFSREVRIDHPERRITGDSVHYSAATGIAEMIGPTTVLLKSDTTVIETLRGMYDTRNEIARATRRSTISQQGRSLAGDSLRYDRRTGLGRAWGQVVMHDPENNSTGKGTYGEYNEIAQRGFITGRAEMVMAQGDEPLHLHADTIFSRTVTLTDNSDSTRASRRITAHRHVRFYRSDLQGVCDTLVHHTADSTIYMYHRPVLWSGTDQITGKHIRITLRDGKAHRLFVEHDAFLISLVDTLYTDQVSSRVMTGHFGDDGLEWILAEGNGRTIYHVREEKDGVQEFIGMNHAECSRIMLRMADGQVSTVTFMDRPDAVLYPMDQIPPEKAQLKGGVWRGEERPVDQEDIFRRVAPPALPHTEGGTDSGIKAAAPIH